METTGCKLIPSSFCDIFPRLFSASLMLLLQRTGDASPFMARLFQPPYNAKWLLSHYCVGGS